MTRTRQDTHTIQTWPSGKSFTYRGDPHGPKNQRSIRGDDPTRPVSPRGYWRNGTPDEWRTIKIALMAEIYGKRDILHCDSALVDALLKASPEPFDGFSVDDMRNLYPDPSDWDAPRCLRWLAEHTSTHNHFAERANRWDDEVASFAAAEEVDPAEWDANATAELRQAVTDQAEPAEVYEWWRVSSWLCGQLDRIGEVTIDNDYGYWWGRTCTGQGWIMDGTLQAIAANYID